MRSLEILFAMRSGAHFPYHATTVEHLIERGHAVTLLFDPRQHRRGPIEHRALDQWLKLHPSVVVGQALQRRGWWRRLLFVTREARSYASYCRRPPEYVIYRKRWKQYLPDWLQRVADTRAGHWLFRQPLTQRLLTAVERLAPPEAAIVEALGRDRPDCVIASPIDMRFDEEVEYVKAARALHIPTVVPVLSWDNLTTKGLIHVQPDLLLAWHAGHRKDALSIHGVPSSRIAVTGSPFFDKWFDSPGSIQSRAATCRCMGLDARRPYVLYLGSSGKIAEDESWLVLRLVEAIAASSQPLVRKAQVVFKPHPANLRAIAKLDQAAVPVWPRNPGLPDTVDTIGEFRDMLHHALCVVGLNTTGMVDAVLCDRPCIALTVREYDSKQRDTVHFRRMVESKAFYLARSVKELVRIMGHLQAGKDKLARARREFMRTHARPRGVGGSAGEAAALAVELAVEGRQATEIMAAIDRQFAGRPTPTPPPVTEEPQPTGAQGIRRTMEKARKSAAFRHYERVRDAVLRMMDEPSDGEYSAYWKAEVAGFGYMFDASPMVIARLREHASHVTGVKAYEYRAHHHGKREKRLAFKLQLLQALDSRGLFVPEAPYLGGFGFKIDGVRVNLDTLKFYECLIALERAGVLDCARSPGRRFQVVEIGAGWGGFAYQFRTLFPHTTYVIVDLPPTLLFSATYLGVAFPEARLKFYGDGPDEGLLDDLDQTDFVFLPAHAVGRVGLPQADLAVNIASFQEMTGEQVARYVDRLADAGCPTLYSLNKERSKFNEELSSVTAIMSTRYQVEPIDVLEVPYNVLIWEPGEVFDSSTKHYRHAIGRRLDRRDRPSEWATA